MHKIEIFKIVCIKKIKCALKMTSIKQYDFEVDPDSDEEYEDDLICAIKKDDKNRPRNFFGTLTSPPVKTFVGDFEEKNKIIDIIKETFISKKTKETAFDYFILQREMHTGKGKNSGNYHYHFFLTCKNPTTLEDKEKVLKEKFTELFSDEDFLYPSDKGLKLEIPKQPKRVIGYHYKDRKAHEPVIVEGKNTIKIEQIEEIVEWWNKIKTKERKEKQEKKKIHNNRGVGWEINLTNEFINYTKKYDYFYEITGKCFYRNGVFYDFNRILTFFERSTGYLGNYGPTANNVLQNLINYESTTNKFNLVKVDSKYIEFNEQIIFNLMKGKPLTDEEKENMYEIDCNPEDETKNTRIKLIPIKKWDIDYESFIPYKYMDLIKKQNFETIEEVAKYLIPCCLRTEDKLEYMKQHPDIAYAAGFYGESGTGKTSILTVLDELFHRYKIKAQSEGGFTFSNLEGYLFVHWEEVCPYLLYLDKRIRSNLLQFIQHVKINKANKGTKSDWLEPVNSFFTWNQCIDRLNYRDSKFNPMATRIDTKELSVILDNLNEKDITTDIDEEKITFKNNQFMEELQHDSPMFLVMLSQVLNKTKTKFTRKCENYFENEIKA